MLRWAVVLGSWAALSYGACVVEKTTGGAAQGQTDALLDVFAKIERCPTSAPALQIALEKTGLEVLPSMVANRGRHNDAVGSFSFFERVVGPDVDEGTFFYGHFTTKEAGIVVLEQEPSEGALLVELIVWDRKKEVFNFYELIGTGKSAVWFYRGDSNDALRDNRYVHRKPPQGVDKFGKTMRCSACHSSGGPILKELVAPHNDWWTKSRPALVKNEKASETVRGRLARLVETSVFAQSVRTGIDRLEASRAYQKGRRALSLPEQLRPLFCENEINLESDGVPFDDNAAKVRVSSASIISPKLASFAASFDGARYRTLLAARNLRFDVLPRRDGDHAWLVPVKGYSDLKALQSLVAEKVVDEEFVADVLAVDFETPLFSAQRCALLALVPEKATDRWPDEFHAALEASSLLGAKELLTNLDNRARTAADHRDRAAKHVAKWNASAATEDGSQAAFEKLLWQRVAVRKSDISKNPKGEILEPRFRRIFPAIPVP